MHITAMRHGMLGADAIVARLGSRSPPARRTACGCRARTPSSSAFFGDGAVEPGHLPRGREPRRRCSTLPVVFVCENNRGRSRRRSEQPSTCRTSPIRAAGYGFPGEVVDGNDVCAVREAAERAVARARAGEGPTLIEAKTYRITPHSAATPSDDRDPGGARRSWRARDPIARFGGALVERRLVDRRAARRARGARRRREVEDAADVRAGLAASGPGGGADGRLRAGRLERRRQALVSERRRRDARADDGGGAQRGAPRGDGRDEAVFVIGEDIGGTAASSRSPPGCSTSSARRG